MIRFVLSFSLIALSASVVAADEKSQAAPDPMAGCPMHAQHMKDARPPAVRADGSAEHGRHVDGRHDSFGMSHTKSTHSFRLFEDGGAIELRASDAADQMTVAAIRKHLQEITPQFSEGDFSTPQFVHGYAPDGVAQLTRLRGDIAYRYQPLEGGGRIRITATSAEALEAVHAFLRFQVVEHRTTNTGKVEEDDRVKE